MEWNEEKAKKIVQQHKKRFSIKFALQTIRILFLVFIIFAVYKMTISIIYDQTTIGKRTAYYQQLAIDWTYPELSTTLLSNSQQEITPFLTQKISMPLVKPVGKSDEVVANLSLRKPVFTAFTTVEIDRFIPHNDTDSLFQFDLPIDPRTDQVLTGQNSPEVWQTLEKLHDGHVANMAFSVDDYYTPSELIELLSNYDLDILWMPLYMGELQKFSEGGSGGEDGQTLSIHQPWGLASAREIDEDFMGGALASVLDQDSIDVSEQAMLENMEKMLNKNRKTAERLLNTKNLQKRFDYVQKEGFRAYGAVVTGPVKELLKLKELEEIRGAQLGDIKPWNWD